ncbi:hypothetical protein PQX77_012776 [Marasmius sp. AFHP31]|nr:hypothetical protein PQX77_012776 [Marasmius sp. AFHP31]
MRSKGLKRSTADFEQDVTRVVKKKKVRTSQMIDDRGTKTITQPSPKKDTSRVRQTPSRPIATTSTKPSAQMDSTPEAEDNAGGEKDKQALFKEELSRRMKLLGDYFDKMKQATHLMLDRESDPKIGQPCKCKAGTRLVRCLECDACPVLCSQCWIEAHKYNPLHWAYLWSGSGYFVKHDISALKVGYSIPLGHDGETCPHPTQPQYLIIADTNGVHATRVSYCGCEEGEKYDKWTRLFKHDLFPSTTLDPQSCFTFRMLRHYDIFTLQAKITPYDYMKSVRRLTDNVFTGNVPDLYKQFMIIIRIWDLLSAERRSGRAHELPNPTTQDLIVECPACPTASVNMEPGWTKTPSGLRHLHQTRLTLDGNYHANHYAKKNSDKNDVSLWLGRGYLPVAAVYNAHCGLEEASSTEKSVCGHLKTINKQNKVKFKNMDISGIVNCQCCHIFIRSTSNLKCGERWVSVDECLSRGVSQRFVEEDGVTGQMVVSFDAMCSYCKGIPNRWLKMHPELAYLVYQMQWVIPVYHCRNHISSCEPLFLYTYKEGVGEFKGKTAELVWDCLNAIGPSIRQMSLGSREDTLNAHIGDWNWRKLVGIIRQLYNEIIDLKALYAKRRDHLIGLWALYGQRAVEWAKLDRSPKVVPGRKLAVKSVYTHDIDAKAPTLQSLVEQMRRSEEDFETPTGTQRVGSVIGFLEEAIALMSTQEHIRRVARKKTAKDPSSNDFKELSGRRRKLEQRLKAFRKLQGQLMPADAASRYRRSLPCDPEDEPLCAPSDFSMQERLTFQLVALANKQANLIRGRLFDLLRALRRKVRELTAAGDRKVKNDKGQDANTRAMSYIKEIQAKRDGHLQDYNFFRDALEKLCCLDPEEWPKLTIKDTYRKSTEQRRQPGSSHTVEGVLWSNLGTASSPIPGDLNADEDKLDLSGDPDSDASVSFFGTQMTKMKAHGPPSPKKPKGKGKDDGGSEKPSKQIVVEEAELDESSASNVKEDGWIWSYRALKRMNQKEVEAWEEESDKVQFFRAEAEYERVREELEYKHSCFGNVIRYHAAKRDLWRSCLGKGMGNGHEAYAREHADMFEALRLDGEAKLQRCGVSILLDISNGETLAERVTVFREMEEKHFPCERLTRSTNSSSPSHFSSTDNIVDAEQRVKDFKYKTLQAQEAYNQAVNAKISEDTIKKLKKDLRNSKYDLAMARLDRGKAKLEVRIKEKRSKAVEEAKALDGLKMVHEGKGLAEVVDEKRRAERKDTVPRDGSNANSVAIALVSDPTQSGNKDYKNKLLNVPTTTTDVTRDSSDPNNIAIVVPRPSRTRYASEDRENEILDAPTSTITLPVEDPNQDHLRKGSGGDISVDPSYQTIEKTQAHEREQDNPENQSDLLQYRRQEESVRPSPSDRPPLEPGGGLSNLPPSDPNSYPLDSRALLCQNGEASVTADAILSLEACVQHIWQQAALSCERLGKTRSVDNANPSNAKPNINDHKASCKTTINEHEGLSIHCEEPFATEDSYGELSKPPGEVNPWVSKFTAEAPLEENGDATHVELNTGLDTRVVVSFVNDDAEYIEEKEDTCGKNSLYSEDDKDTVKSTYVPQLDNLKTLEDVIIPGVEGSNQWVQWLWWRADRTHLEPGSLFRVLPAYPEQSVTDSRYLDKVIRPRSRSAIINNSKLHRHNGGVAIGFPAQELFKEPEKSTQDSGRALHSEGRMAPQNPLADEQGSRDGQNEVLQHSDNLQLLGPAGSSNQVFRPGPTGRLPDSGVLSYQIGNGGITADGAPNLPRSKPLNTLAQDSERVLHPELEVKASQIPRTTIPVLADGQEKSLQGSTGERWLLYPEEPSSPVTRLGPTRCSVDSVVFPCQNGNGGSNAVVDPNLPPSRSLDNSVQDSERVPLPERGLIASQLPISNIPDFADGLEEPLRQLLGKRPPLKPGGSQDDTLAPVPTSQRARNSHTHSRYGGVGLTTPIKGPLGRILQGLTTMWGHLLRLAYTTAVGCKDTVWQVQIESRLSTITLQVVIVVSSWPVSGEEDSISSQSDLNDSPNRSQYQLIHHKWVKAVACALSLPAESSERNEDTALTLVGAVPCSAKPLSLSIHTVPLVKFSTYHTCHEELRQQPPIRMTAPVNLIRHHTTVTSQPHYVEVRTLRESTLKPEGPIRKAPAFSNAGLPISHSPTFHDPRRTRDINQRLNASPMGQPLDFERTHGF